MCDRSDPPSQHAPYPDKAAHQPHDDPVPIQPELSSIRVVGLGACGMDMLAYVDSFPVPDSKIRTRRVLHTGGGNCANTLTGMRRLGLQCSLIALLGQDSAGRAARDELQRDGIDTTLTPLMTDISTPFTYVIVDEQRQSRTCIHTPSQRDLRPEDLSDSPQNLLEGASLLHLDGRHTILAIALAEAANDMNIPVLLDVERDRPFITALVGRADYIVTNSTYPFVFAPEAAYKVDAMAKILAVGRARFVISTGGSSGSTLVARESDAPRGPQDPQVLVTREIVQVFGLENQLGNVAVLNCPAWPVQKVVDTTGAGDAFIAGVGYGLCVGLSLETTLALAARIAASKIGKLGARDGLPRREQLGQHLLVPLPRL